MGKRRVKFLRKYKVLSVSWKIRPMSDMLQVTMESRKPQPKKSQHLNAQPVGYTYLKLSTYID